MATTPNPTRCHDPKRLRALLNDRLPAEEQAELAGHLEGCAPCRAALERMAAESHWWTDARRLAGDSESKGKAVDEPQAEPTSEGPPFDFLGPPAAPGYLGRFGPYDVIEFVGQGGSGMVFKALDPSLHRLVAVKVLAPQVAANASARRRFLREARAAASISHDHVVTIHAVDEANGLPYLVMQYVAGKSLQERIGRTGPLELKEILRIGMQAASGLAAAHAQGLIHRDVKPANILLENGIERVKLTDFGLARAVDDASLTQSGVIAGTPQYMAPEQARGEAVDPRADLFGLGGVLYAMATGHSPFRAPTTMAVLRRVCDETPRPIREANPEFPPWLSSVIDRLLAKDPADRYPSASEVAAVLSGHLARLQQSSPAEPLEPIAASKDRPSRPRRVRRLAGAALVLVLLAVAVAMLNINRDRRAAHVDIKSGTVYQSSPPPGGVTRDALDFALVQPPPAKEPSLPGPPPPLPASPPGIEPSVLPEVSSLDAPLTIERPPLPEPTPRITLNTMGTVFGLAYSPDGRYVVAVAAGDQLLIHDTDSEKSPAPGPTTTDKTEGKIPASPDEGSAFTVTHRINVLGRLQQLAFSPDGKYLATSGGDGMVRLWDAALFISSKPESPEPLVALSWDGVGTSIAFSPDGKLLATGGTDGKVKLWDPAARTTLGIRAGPGEDGKVTRSDPKALLDLPMGPFPSPIASLRFSPDGKTLAVSTMPRDPNERGVQLWRIGAGSPPTAERLGVLNAGPTPSAARLAFSPGTGMLATFAPDLPTVFWDLANGRGSRPPIGSKVTALTFSADGSLIASGDQDGRVTLRDAASFQERATLRAGRAPIQALDFSPDGKSLATATKGSDFRVLIWDVPAGSARPTAEGPPPQVPRSAPLDPPAAEGPPPQAPRSAPLDPLAGEGPGDLFRAGKAGDGEAATAARELARALLEQAEHRLATARADRQSAESQVPQAKAVAEPLSRELRRISSRIRSAGMLIGQDPGELDLPVLQEEQDRLQVANSTERSARVAVWIAEEGAKAAESRVAEAEAERDLARLYLQASEGHDPGRDRRESSLRTLARARAASARAEKSVTEARFGKAKLDLERAIAAREAWEKASKSNRELPGDPNPASANSETPAKRAADAKRGLETALAAEGAAQEAFQAAEALHKARIGLVEKAERAELEGVKTEGGPHRAPK